MESFGLNPFLIRSAANFGAWVSVSLFTGLNPFLIRSAANSTRPKFPHIFNTMPCSPPNIGGLLQADSLLKEQTARARRSEHENPPYPCVINASIPSLSYHRSITIYHNIRRKTRSKPFMKNQTQETRLPLTAALAAAAATRSASRPPAKPALTPAAKTARDRTCRTAPIPRA